MPAVESRSDATVATPHQRLASGSLQDRENAAPTITALVLARDEVTTLPACLASLRFCDEIVVIIDRRGKEQTTEIAKAHADIVTIRHFDSFADQRNSGLELATGDWILSVDADEMVPDGLARAIKAATYGDGLAIAYRIPIRSVIFGKRFRHCGTQDDLPVRLFRREMGRWTGNVHETLVLDGPESRLPLPLEHTTIPDIRSFLQKMDQYTSLHARERHARGERFQGRRMLWRPWREFLRRYIIKSGYLDGWEGFCFSAFSGVSEAVEEWKLRECAGENTPS